MRKVVTKTISVGGTTVKMFAESVKGPWFNSIEDMEYHVARIDALASGAVDMPFNRWLLNKDGSVSPG